MAHLANASKKNLHAPRPKAAAGPGTAHAAGPRHLARKLPGETKHAAGGEMPEDDENAKALRAQRLIVRLNESSHTSQLKGTSSDTARGGLLARFKHEEANRWLSIALEYERKPRPPSTVVSRHLSTTSDVDELNPGGVPPPPPPVSTPSVTGSPQVSPHSFTPGEIAEFRKRFEAVDEDNSGALSFDEVKELMRKASDQGGLISNKKVSEIIALVDVNGDGDIDFDEFILCMQLMKSGRSGALTAFAAAAKGTKKRAHELPVISVTGYTTPYFMLHPSEPWKIQFDMIVGILIIYSVLAVPFRLGFRVEDTDALFWSDVVIDSIFGVDIIVTFRTAFYDDDFSGFETNPWKVAQAYFRGFFLIDFFSTVPIEGITKFFANLILGSSEEVQPGDSVGSMARILRILRLMRLLKILRLAKLGEKGKRRPENDPTDFPTASSLGSMFAMLFFIAHLLCSTWYIILDETRTVNWLNQFIGEVDAHHSLSLWERYVVAIYWAFTTMTTVGFGDIVATNRQEYSIGLLGMLIGASVFGYVIGNVTAMMEMFDPAAAVYNEKMELIKAFVKDRNLPTPIARKVRAHFKYAYLRNTLFDGTASELQSTLPAPAACAASFVQFRETIEALSFLRQAPPLFVKEILACMHPYAASNGECITRDTDLGLALHFLERGSARRYLEIEVSPIDDTKSSCQSPRNLGPRRNTSSFKLQLARSRSSGEFDNLSSSVDEAGKELSCLLSPENLGIEVTRHHSIYGSGVLVVISVVPGSQAANAGVQEGMSVKSVNGNNVKSVEAFHRVAQRRPSQLRRSREDFTAGIPFVFYAAKFEYKPFDDVSNDSILGEAAVLLNTRNLVTAVATSDCELWFVAKEDLEAILAPWPQVRSELCQRGVRFLKAVAICCAEHGDIAGGAASIREMAPHAAEGDLYEDDEMAGACLPAPLEPARTSVADALSGRIVGVEPSPKELPLSLRQNMPGMIQAVETDKDKNSITQTTVYDETPTVRRSSFYYTRQKSHTSKQKGSPVKMPTRPQGNLPKDNAGGEEVVVGRRNDEGRVPLLSTIGSAAQRSRTLSMDAVPAGSLNDSERELNVSVDEVSLREAQASTIQAFDREEAKQTSPVVDTSAMTSGTDPSMTSASIDNGAEDASVDKLTPSELFAKTGLFHPSTTSKLVWDIFLSLVICYSVITVTYQLGFSTQFSGGLAALDIAVDVFFFVDILVTFNTAEKNNDGHLIVNRWSVAQLYASSWFPIDFLSTVPIELIVNAAMGGQENPALRSFKLVRAIRLVRLVKIAHIINKAGLPDKVEEALNLHPAVLQVLKLFIIMLFFGHLFACLLFATAQCDGNGSCWVENYCIVGLVPGSADELSGSACLDEKGFDLRYIASLYWAFTTMTTIGYGDITPNPKAIHELIVTVLTQVIGTTVFAYVVGALVGIIVNLDPAAKMRRQNLQYLNQYLNEARNTFGFRCCLRQHFLFRQKVQSVFSEQQLFTAMHPELRVEVMGIVHGTGMIPRLPELCAVEADLRGALTVVLPRLRPYCYSIDDVVLHPMLGAHREMFFLTAGTIAVETCMDELPRSSKKTLENSTNGSPSVGRGPLVTAATFSKRYTAGESFGEVLALLPAEVHFALMVEAKCTSTTAQAFGLTHADLQSFRATFPLLYDALSSNTLFEENFPHWVDVVAPKSFDYEAMIEEIGVRNSNDDAVEDPKNGVKGDVHARNSRESRENRVTFTASLEPLIVEESELDLSRGPSAANTPKNKPPQAEASSIKVPRASRSANSTGTRPRSRRSSPTQPDNQDAAVAASASKQTKKSGNHSHIPRSNGNNENRRDGSKAGGEIAASSRVKRSNSATSSTSSSNISN